MDSVSPNMFERKLTEIEAHRAAKRDRRFDKAVKITIWGSTYLVAVAALVLGGWSNTIVAHWLGVPGLAGGAAALVLDGIWLVSLAIVQLHRREPWRALTAYQATVGMVVLSALTNFAHGLIRFEASWRGVAAGLLFAMLPVSLKWLVSVSTKNSMGQLLKAPDARNRIKQAGQITAELELNQILAPLANQVINRSESLEIKSDEALDPIFPVGSLSWDFRNLPGELWSSVVLASGQVINKYEVSTCGRVRYVHPAQGYRLVNSTLMSSNGYPKVNISLGGNKKVSKNVHVLVARAFLGDRPSGFVVRHLNGDRSNNQLGNLKYGSPEENRADTEFHRLNPGQVRPEELPVTAVKPALEPARTPEVPKAEPPANLVNQPTTKQERVNDLARRIAERGGQLSSVSFNDLTSWYGIDSSKKSTLSALRKAGHQAYLDGAKTGLYL